MQMASTTRRERPARRRGVAMYQPGSSPGPSSAPNGTASASTVTSGSAASARAVSSSSLISNVVTGSTVPPAWSMGGAVDEAELGGAGRVEQRAVVELGAQLVGRLPGRSDQGIDEPIASPGQIVELRLQRVRSALDSGDVTVAQRDGG